MKNKLIKKSTLEKIILSPRSYNYLKLKTDKGEAEIELSKLTVHQEALLDYSFHILSKLIKPKANQIISLNEIIQIQEHQDKYPKNLGSVSFETKDFRRSTGLRRTDKQIIQDMKDLVGAKVNAKAVKVFYDEGYKKSIDWIGVLFTDGVAKKTERFAPRTKDPQHEIIMTFGLITGLIFCNDIMRMRFCLFPTKFYKMSFGTQKILRYISLWDWKKLSLKHVSELLDWRQAKNPRNRIKRIESYFNELKESGFILNWIKKENTRGLKTSWKIFGIKTTRGLEINKKELLSHCETSQI